MGIPERSSSVGIGPLGDNAVRMRYPDLSIRRIEDVAASKDNAAGRNLTAHAFTAFPITVGVCQIIRRIHIKSRNFIIQDNARADNLKYIRIPDLGHVVIFRDGALEYDLVADLWRVITTSINTQSGVVGTDVNINSIRAIWICIRSGSRILQEEGVTGISRARLGQKNLIINTLDGHRLSCIGRGEGGAVVTVAD